MDIPIGVKVFCLRARSGRTTCVIVDPIRKAITHIVVQEKGLSGIERLVPVAEILESQPDRITLRWSQNGFAAFEPFIESRFIGGKDEFLEYKVEHYYFHPFLAPDFGEDTECEPLIEERERIPPDELGIHRGAQVRTTDGKIGVVDEFLISPVDDKISHLVLREGHLWGERHVTIPVSEIDHIGIDQVDLKLSKQAIGELPTIPVKRQY